jgi:hypothetical protein
MVAIIIPYNGVQYSGGSAGGSSLKFAVKVPNFVTLSVAAVVQLMEEEAAQVVEAV